MPRPLCFLGLLLALAPGAAAQSFVNVNVSEQITVPDAPTALPHLDLLVAETVTVTDTPSAFPNIDLRVDELVTVDDATTALPNLNLTVVETIEVHDGIDESLLPVELVDFTATAEGTSIVLAWKTASETNNAGFDVEWQGESGAAWQALTFVPGRGTTAEAQAYTHRVADLGPGLHRFRLRQVDFDGAAHLLPEIEVRVALVQAYDFAIGPNPFQAALRR